MTTLLQLGVLWRADIDIIDQTYLCISCPKSFLLAERVNGPPLKEDRKTEKLWQNILTPFMFSAILWWVSMKVLGLMVLCVAVFLSESKAASMNEYQMESLDSGAYNVMWKYDMLMDTFMFNVTVNATGWVAIWRVKKLRNDEWLWRDHRRR